MASVMIAAHWCESQNVGDALNPWMIFRTWGRHPVYAQQGADYVHHMYCGSILNRANENTIAWGCGLARCSDEVHPDANIRAVRGPLSRAIAMASGAKVPPIFGDGALVMPRLFTPKNSKKVFELGIVPHYVDQFAARTHYEDVGKDVKIIDVFSPPETVISQIVACERIVSSSLHGLVLADAYRVPNKWVEFSDSIQGDGTKYRDHMMAVGVTPYEPLDCRTDAPPVEELIRWVGDQCVSSFDDRALWEAMPRPA